jgi:fatty acid desaturase
MNGIWQRFEGPTWLVAATIYGGWIELALGHLYVPLLIAVPLGIYLTAWHASLQHETIHALRKVPRTVRTLLAFPPLGIWFPYEWYRCEHLRHHATRELAAPRDPESFYHEPEAWIRMNAPLRALYMLNQTFAGRLLVGPALLISGTYAKEVRRLLQGDSSHAGAWGRHFVSVGALLWLLAHWGVNPIAYVACIAYPAASLGLVRSFAEHRYAQPFRERTAIVESRSALSLLFLNNNLHAVHHRYPRLPWFELPRRYRTDLERNPLGEYPPPLRGYRTVARSWLWRPIDVPVAGQSQPILRRFGWQR